MSKDSLDITAECTEIYMNFDFLNPKYSLSYLASKFVELFNAKSAEIYRDDGIGSRKLVAAKSRMHEQKSDGVEYTIEPIKETLYIPPLDSNISYSVEIEDGIKLKDMEQVIASIVNIFIKKLLGDLEVAVRARYDIMTMAYNRNEFESVKEKIKAQEKIEPIIVSFIDVFSLKTTNDTYGHDAGDKYINTVAEAIKKHVVGVFGNDVSFFRSGGDEFVVLCMAKDEEDARKKAELIGAKLDEAKTFVEEASYSIVGLPGVTSFDHGESYGLSNDLSQVLLTADTIMFESKRKHKLEKKIKL